MFINLHIFKAIKWHNDISRHYMSQENGFGSSLTETTSFWSVNSNLKWPNDVVLLNGGPERCGAIDQNRKPINVISQLTTLFNFVYLSLSLSKVQNNYFLYPYLILSFHNQQYSACFHINILLSFFSFLIWPRYEK